MLIVKIKRLLNISLMPWCNLNYEEKLELEVSIPRKLYDEWEPTIKIKIKDHECYAIFTFNLYHKNTKNIYLIIPIRSRSRKWSWRDWQPLYRVGCEVLICLCRYVVLACSLLLDWYLGSEKLREILTLLCYITLSSSRENQHSAQEVALRYSGVA